MKECNKCHRLLDKSQFCKHRHNKDGLSYTCRDCRKKYQERYCKENKDEINRKHRIYNHEHRKQRGQQYREWREQRHLLVVYVYSDGYVKCKLCNEDDLDVLTIDHINGGGTKHLKKIPNADLYAWLINESFPDGFRVLCWNCQHREKLRLADEKRILKEKEG
jgi:hypothetical protein